MTRAQWRRMLHAEQGPVSRFVQGMPGFQLVPWVPGSGVLAILFVCGPERPEATIISRSNRSRMATSRDGT